MVNNNTKFTYIFNNNIVAAALLASLTALWFGQMQSK